MSELDTILAGIDSGSDDPLGTGDDGGVIGDRTTQARRSDAVPTTTTRRRTGRRSQRDTGVTLPEVTPEEAAQVESQVQQDDVMGGGPTPNPGSTVPARQQEELATEQPERQIPIVDSGGRPLGIVANVRLSDETDDIFILNDLVFKIPPLAIQIVKHSFTQTEKTLRTSNAMKSKSGQSECEIIFTIAFVGRDQFRKHLRRLIANFKYAPIAFIENSFIRNQVNPDFIFGPGTSMAVILESLSVTTVEQQPETLMAECRCKLFNYKPFSSNFFYKKDWRTRGQLGVQESILGDLDALTSRFGSQAIRPNVAADDINGPPSAFLAADQQGLVGTSPVRFPGNSQGFNLLIKTALDEKMDYVPDSWTNKIKFSFREYRRVSLPPELVEIQSRPTAIRPTPLPPAQPAPVTPAAELIASSAEPETLSLPSAGRQQAATRGLAEQFTQQGLGNDCSMTRQFFVSDPLRPGQRQAIQAFHVRNALHGGTASGQVGSGTFRRATCGETLEVMMQRFPVALFRDTGTSFEPLGPGFGLRYGQGSLGMLGGTREKIVRLPNGLYSIDGQSPYRGTHVTIFGPSHPRRGEVVTGSSPEAAISAWRALSSSSQGQGRRGFREYRAMGGLTIVRAVRAHLGQDISVSNPGRGQGDVRPPFLGHASRQPGRGNTFGVPIVSPVDGTIHSTSPGTVYVRGAYDGLYYYLYHMMGVAPGIRAGVQVAAGTVVGYIGSYGTDASGPHLHMQILTGPNASPTANACNLNSLCVLNKVRQTAYLPPRRVAPLTLAQRTPPRIPTSPETTRTRQTESGPVTTPTPQAQEQASQAITSLGTRFEISQNAQQIFNSYIAQNAVNGWRFYSEQLPQVMDVFYRDYEDADGVGLNILHEDEELVPVGANVVYQNSFATIPLLSHQYPTYQFMGGNDCVFAIRFNGIGQEKLQRLQLMFDLMESNARNFRFVKDSAIVNISDNEFLNLFSVKRLVTENIEVRTHASNPNLYDVTLTFSEFKTTKEMLVRENTTARGLVEQILRRVFNGANSGAGNDFLRASPNVAIADRAREVAWLRSQMEAIVDQIHRTETRIFSPEVSGPYGDLYGAERLLHGTFRGADASIIDQVQAGSSLDPATQVRRGVRRGGDALASIIEAASNLSGVDSQGLPAQIRAGTGNTPGTSERDREIREQNTSQLRELRARLLSIGEQIYNHGADGEFDDFFPEVARAISSGEGDQQLSGSAYPDLILPLHPSTNRSLDVNPDFYFWNDNSDGGIARLLENDLLAAQGFLSNSYQSFSSIVGIDGDTDWFTKEYLSRTVQSIDQQAQNNANGTPANPYRTMYGWDGSPGATNSSQIGTPSTFFDNLLKTSSGTRVPLVADFTGNRTPYRVLIEATYGTGQNPVSFGARNGERNPLAEHNFSLNHVKSLLNEAIMSFKESALKMARAFPTFKLYFLQENSQSPSHFVSFDDFYSYSSVKEIRITRHRKIPAGLCMIRLTNLSGILSNASYWNRANNPNMIFANGRGEDNGGIPSGNLQVYNPFRHDLGDDARHENAFDALLLKEGCKIQVRMGYDNNADNLPIVFTGQIVEISNAGRPDELAIVAQDYGVELVLEQKGKDPEQQATFSDTMELLCGMICSPELLHFGRWDLNTEYSPFEVRSANSNRSVTTVGGYLTNWILPVESINRFMLKWQFLNDPQDDNLFPPPANTYIAQGILGSFIDSVFGNNSENACKYTPQGNTVWDVFKEMELRHPGWIAQPEYYGDRMTMFFGIPSQRYWARPFSAREQMVQRRANRDLESTQQRRTDLLREVDERIASTERSIAAVERTLRRRETANVGILTIEPPSQGQIESIVSLNRTLETLRANLIVQRTERTAQAGIQDAVIDNLQDASASLANGRLKAFRSYHLLTSFNHIISNEIKASSKNLPNAIQVGYYDLAPSLGTFGANPQEVADSLGIRTPFGNNNFDYLKVMSIKADDNISDHMTQYAYYTSPNCRTRFLARRYACALIARNLKDAYKGRLIVTGEPKIKPYDLCYIFDSYTDMFGPCEVKGVTHIFDEDGFRTEIMPDMVVNINEWSCCGVMDALQLVAMRLGVIHGQFSTTGRDIDAFVVNNAGTILGGAAAVGTAGGVAAAVAPRLGAGVGTSPALLAYPLVAPAALLAAGTAYLAMWGGLKYIQWTQERQPVIVTPLLFGGKPFVAGLDGFKQDGLVSNTLGKFRRWSEDFGLGLQGLLAGGRIDQLQAEVMRSLGASTTGLAILGRGVGGVIAP